MSVTGRKSSFSHDGSYPEAKRFLIRLEGLQIPRAAPRSALFRAADAWAGFLRARKAGRAGEPGRCARRCRNRACHQCIRARAKRRPDRCVEPDGDGPSQADHQGDYSAQPRHESCLHYSNAAMHSRWQVRVNFCRSSPDGYVRFGQLRTWAKLWQRRDGPLADLRSAANFGGSANHRSLQPSL